jgi:threonine dehydrogenase-like Zn-dependent dehydrogenase
VQAITFDTKVNLVTNYPDPEPAPGECVVAVHCAGICTTDLEIIRGYMHFTGVLGHEMVGRVIDGPEQWKGKRVACEINCVCGSCDMCRSGLTTHCRSRTVLGIAGRDGVFAERVRVPERNLHEVPSIVSDDEAVFIEPLAAAYQVIKQCPIDPRMTVAVVGSGRLGLLLAQVLAATGCRLQVVGRNPKTLQYCEKKHIQTVSVDEIVPRQDHDVVVECTGGPAGLELSMGLVRPRGIIVLKSTYADPAPLNLAPVVINEVTVLGSRCGPFAEAINALARKEVDVLPMIARTFKLDRGLEALEAAADADNIKVLLRVRPS